MNENKVKELNKILGVDESYKATDTMFRIIYDRKQREEIMKKLLKFFNNDVSFDWFRDYFECEQAERKTKKQDFTPQELTDLLSNIVGNSNFTFDCCCGTGGIVITKWNNDKNLKTIFNYKPSDYFYYCEEISDKAIPFLLFNLALRGMNAIVCHCDSISRKCKGVFFVYNEKDDYLGFSTINLMPYNEKTEKEFRVSFTDFRYNKLVESQRPKEIML